MRFIFFKKILNKTTMKVLFCIICILFLIVSPTFIFDSNKYRLDLNEFFSIKNSSKVVLTLYHVETFEGGTNSRTKYLERQAIKFNKENTNCFIVVKNLTAEQLALNIRNNNVPDMFSFGVTVGEFIQGFLKEQSKNNSVRSDLIKYGYKNDLLLAQPYILSGYCLISYEKYLNDEENSSSFITSKLVNNKEIKGLSLAESNNLNGVDALTSNNITCKENDLLFATDNYNAYVNFINKKSISLLGTSRDLARVKNRELNGSISPCRYKFLSGYSDLIQYISIVDNNDKSIYAQKFIDYILSPSSQKELCNYGLFSVDNQKIYTEDYMSEFEDVLKCNLSSVNAFISKNDYKTNNELVIRNNLML